MAQTKKNTGIWGWIDKIQGDKVIWMIVILLILYSCVGIFSSTSQLANSKTSRLDIFGEQIIIVLIGLGVILFCYTVMKVGWIRWFSQFGFILSAGLLIAVMFYGEEVNGAKRYFMLRGFQINVYEIVKVAMVLYLSWAVHAYKTDSLKIANKLSKYRPLSFLGKAGWKRFMYFYFPITFVIGCIISDGFSSAIFIGGVMILTVIMGGVPAKDIVKLILCAVLLLGGTYLAYKISGGKVLEGRWSTVESRIGMFFHPADKKEIKPGTKEWQDHLDEIRQPMGAKIAIKEGGVLGKGPGQSTQKYAVGLIFSDFMFSFIIEEYGLVFGAIPLVLLYLCLFARGKALATMCENEFARMAVAGLTLLISSQAMLHMLINVGLWPLTGQTLPMISHGSLSFLCFSGAFGVILCISKMVKKKMDKAIAEADSLIVPSDDDVKSGLDDLDAFESKDE